MDRNTKIRNVLMPMLFCLAWALIGNTVVGMTSNVRGTMITDMIVIMTTVPCYYCCFKSTTVKSVKDSVLPITVVYLILIWTLTQGIGTYVIQYDNRISDVVIDAADIGLYYILTLVIAPIFEEFLMRGIFYTCYKSFAGIFGASLATSFIFGLLHGTLTQGIIGFFAGIMFCFIFEATDNIWMCVLMHSLYNFLTVVLTPQIPCGFWTVILHSTCLVMLLLAYYVRYVLDRSCGSLSCPNLRQKCVNDKL